MRKLLGAFGLAIVLCLAAAPAAFAAQEFGDRCEANDALVNPTVILSSNGQSGALLPSNVPPEGSKVITRWKVNAPLGIEPTQQQLVAFGPSGSANGFEMSTRKVAESAVETVVGGSANEFATRIPIREYAHIGLHGTARTLICDEANEHVTEIASGPTWLIGEVREYSVAVNTGVPVIAWVEPDGDGDGYGDETQDACPRLAAMQAPCMSTHVAATAKLTKGAILVEATPSEPAQVWVSGRVAWTAKPRKGAAKDEPVTVKLSGGPARGLNYQESAVFTVPLPKAVQRQLAKMAPRELLKARLKVRMKPGPGNGITHSLTVKLKGRKVRG